MLTATQLRAFEATARKDAKDYRKMASMYPAHHAYYLKCAADRADDASFYSTRAADMEARAAHNQEREAA
jgi:hypothetical protein